MGRLFEPDRARLYLFPRDATPADPWTVPEYDIVTMEPSSTSSNPVPDTEPPPVQVYWFDYVVNGRYAAPDELVEVCKFAPPRDAQDAMAELAVQSARRKYPELGADLVVDKQQDSGLYLARAPWKHAVHFWPLIGELSRMVCEVQFKKPEFVIPPATPINTIVDVERVLIERFRTQFDAFAKHGCLREVSRYLGDAAVTMIRYLGPDANPYRWLTHMARSFMWELWTRVCFRRTQIHLPRKEVVMPDRVAVRTWPWEVTYWEMLHPGAGFTIVGDMESDSNSASQSTSPKNRKGKKRKVRSPSESEDGSDQAQDQEMDDQSHDSNSLDPPMQTIPAVRLPSVTGTFSALPPLVADGMCQKCFEQPVETAMYPCNCSVLCSACALLVESDPGAQKVCYGCRKLYLTIEYFRDM